MNIKKWHIAGAVFTIVLGTLNHFFYDWSGSNPLIAPFSPINESTWEHLKLLVTPVILFSVIEYFAYGKLYPGFIPSRVFSLLCGMAAIVILFYSYTAVIGRDILWVDISIFLIAVILCWSISYTCIQNGRFASLQFQFTARIVLAFLLVAFLLFTVQPPQFFLFQDPITGQYGL